MSLASAILLAFTIGRAARIILIEGPRRALLAPHDQSAMFVRPDYHEPSEKRRGLPSPVLLKGKEMPRTMYTSKNFDTAASKVASLILENNDENEYPSNKNSFCSSEDDDSKECSRGKGDALETGNVDDDDDEEEHLPAGQHLLVDIKNVDSSFLNSAERLAQAMIDVVELSRLTLLSYHCHSLTPAGVSCAGVLLESHVSFHTWPAEGVITLDLFTCGAGPLMPVLPVLESLFAVPRQPSYVGEEVEQPEMVWGHMLRGFRTADEHIKDDNPFTADLGLYFLQDMGLEYKKLISTNFTDFQRIDVADMINSHYGSKKSYLKSLSNDGSYESQHPEFFSPERRVYLDGVLQSSSKGNEQYHEALVQPAMFAHKNPKRVVIVGGGECATLREVLKHNTIEKVTMVEIDEQMVQVSKENLPTWSDCSDLEGSEAWCGDDKRAELRYEDALKWFLDRYLNKDTITEDRIDLMIMDALDPQDNVQFADALYKNTDFLEAIFNSLNDDGIVIMQLGISPYSLDPPEQFSKQTNRDYLTKNILKIGFHSIHVYEESHCMFDNPWTFLVAFKDYNSREMWFRNTADIQLAIRKRMLKTKSGEPALKYFDGATMKSYQVPHKAYETVYCRGDPTPEDCYRWDESFRSDNVVEHSLLEVKASNIGHEGGRGVFTKVDISEGSVLSMKQLTEVVEVPSPSVSLINRAVADTVGMEALKKVQNYMYGYGWQSNIKGPQSIFVESSILCFMNHGCNHTFNYGVGRDVDEQTTAFKEKQIQTQFNPYIDRRLYLNERGDHALKDIKSGEELLQNYLDLTLEDEWEQYAEELRAICNKEKLGIVSREEEI